jgi:hypothetical protein
MREQPDGFFGLFCSSGLFGFSDLTKQTRQTKQIGLGCPSTPSAWRKEGHVLAFEQTN